MCQSARPRWACSTSTSRSRKTSPSRNGKTATTGLKFEVAMAFLLYAVCVSFCPGCHFSLLHFLYCSGFLWWLYRRVSFACINACIRAEALYDVIQINNGEFRLEPAAEAMMNQDEDPKLTHMTAANWGLVRNKILCKTCRFTCEPRVVHCKIRLASVRTQHPCTGTDSLC